MATHCPECGGPVRHYALLMEHEDGRRETALTTSYNSAVAQERAESEFPQGWQVIHIESWIPERHSAPLLHLAAPKGA